MSNFKKKSLIFLLAAILILFLVGFSLAKEEGKALEVQYPEVGGWRPETIQQAVLPQYIKYIFNFSVALAGLVAFGALIYGGFRYLTSVGAPTAQTEAKDQIFAGIIGLVILLSSYLILTTINPQLVMLNLEPAIWPELEYTEPGVYLLDENENILGVFKTSQSDLGELKGKIKKIKLVNPTVWNPELEKKVVAEYFYGAILHQDTGREGNAKIYRGKKGVVTSGAMNVPEGRDASLTVFQEVEKTYGEVILCSEPEFKECTPHSGATDPGDPPHIEGVWSLKITGNYLLILFGVREGPVKGGPYYAIFEGRGSWPNLKDHPINQCGLRKVLGLFWLNQESCASQYIIIPVLSSASGSLQ